MTATWRLRASNRSVRRGSTSARPETSRGSCSPTRKATNSACCNHDTDAPRHRPLFRREHPTDIGPVDLLCRDADGRAVAIEVKRRGEIDGVEQLARYLERLNHDPMLRPVRGILVAQIVKPQARVLAESRGIDWVEIDYDELRGLESDALRLF